MAPSTIAAIETIEEATEPGTHMGDTINPTPIQPPIDDATTTA